MDIACPNCSAAYRVPDALVLSRKPVRCAACGSRWVPDLPQEVTLGPDGPLPAPDMPGPEADPRSIGPTDAAPEDQGSHPAAMSIGPASTESLTETGALTPRPATPPPLAETRWPAGGAAGRNGDAASRRLRGAALLPLAWAGSLVLVGGLLAVLTLFRHDLAAAWPPFEWVVRLLGG